jgi:hypothetical protein
MLPMFWFTGVVEDRIDPLQLGRVKVRIFGIHTDDTTKISTEDLPWANVMMPANSASISGVGISPTGLVEGSWVVGFFADGENAQDPIIMGSLPSKSTQPLTELKSFKDPEGRFPRWFNETDVSRAAREQTWKSHESYADRYTARVTGVETATKPLLDTTTNKTTGETRSTWSEPEPRDGFSGLYPYVHTYESESGIVKEYDDTPNATRIVEYHPTGTFYEIYSDGKKVSKIVGDHYEIIIRDENILVRGNQNITIEGNATQLIKGDYTVEVAGNYNLKVHGERNTKITKNDNIEIIGNNNTNVKENSILRVGKDQTILIDNNKTESIGGSSTLTCTGAADYTFLDNYTMFSNGAQSISTNSSQRFLSKRGLEFGSQADWNLKCNANLTITTAGNFTIDSTGNFAVTASRIDLN